MGLSKIAGRVAERVRENTVEREETTTAPSASPTSAAPTSAAPTAVDEGDRFEVTSGPVPSAPEIPAPIPRQPEIPPAAESDDDSISDERRDEIEAFDQALEDEDYLADRNHHEEVELIQDAVRGDSELGELTEDEQAYLLDLAIDRWSDLDADYYDRQTNYWAIDELAYGSLDDPELQAPVSEALARQSIELEEGLFDGSIGNSVSERGLAATFASHAVIAAGTDEGRRELIENLGPEDAASLMGSLGRETSSVTTSFGSAASNYDVAQSQGLLLHAINDGEPTEATAAVVDAAFATATREDLREQDGFVADELAEAIATHWHPDDAELAASETERLQGIFDSGQGREYLFSEDLTYEGRLENLARVQANPEWDRDLFTSESSVYDVPTIVFDEFADTARQYEDLRGDEPVELSGTDLENTVGFAMGFPPQGIDPDETDAERDAREEAMARGDHSLFEGEPAQEVVEPVADAIRSVGGDDPEVTVLPIQFAADGVGTVELPLFRVVDEDTGAERFVDNVGRVYDDFDDWKKNNVLPPGNVTYPQDGHLDEKVTLATRNTPNTIDTPGERISAFLDTASLVGGTIAGGAIILGSGGTLAPVVVGAAASWQVYRSADQLYDRYQHGQSVNPLEDPAARAAWLDVGAGALSIASLGATGVAGRLVNTGSRYAASGATAASFLRVGAGALDAAAAGNAGYTLLTEWDDLSGAERANLALSVGFWGVGAATNARPFDLEGRRTAALYDQVDATSARRLQQDLPDDVAGYLARSEAFQDLTPAQRRTFLDDNLESFDALARTPEFDALSPRAKQRLVERWGDLDVDVRQRYLDLDPGHGAFRAQVADVVGTDGFARLDAAEQTRLLDLIGGENPQISRPVRQALHDMVTSREWRGYDANQQRVELEAFLADPRGLPQVSDGMNNHARPPGVSPNVSMPTTIGRYPFRGGSDTATSYTVDVHGQQVEVVINNRTAPNGQRQPTIDEIADGLARLPPEALQQVDRVVIESAPNPSDAYWQNVYGEPGFTSYMTADTPNRTINVYPSPSHYQNTLASSFAHEIGHFESQGRWGYNSNDTNWEPWRDAIDADTTGVSRYASQNPQEDFAETYAVYLDVLGTPREAELRALMPERFAILDTIHGAP